MAKPFCQVSGNPPRHVALQERSDSMRIYTLGVYGFTEARFLERLQSLRPDVFLDTRRRRAVRGSLYAFANSTRLQNHLRDLGIPYVHRLDLAPSNATRRAQDAIDTDQKIRRRDRETLSGSFITAYNRECLNSLQSESFLESLGPDVHSIVIFCVERHPEACHRSLLAARLANDLGAEVEHIVP